jgi:hypothetical protein
MMRTRASSRAGATLEHWAEKAGWKILTIWIRFLNICKTDQQPQAWEHIHPGGERVVLNELSARLDQIAHQTNGNAIRIARKVLRWRTLAAGFTKSAAVPTHMSRYKVMVARGGTAPPILRFSSACSAN